MAGIERTMIDGDLLDRLASAAAAPAPVAETGNDPANAVVDASDESGARGNRSGFTRVGVTSPWDFNRDGRVNSADVTICRNNLSGTRPLVLITPPVHASVVGRNLFYNNSKWDSHAGFLAGARFGDSSS